MKIDQVDRSIPKHISHILSEGVPLTYIQPTSLVIGRCLQLNPKIKFWHPLMSFQTSITLSVEQERYFELFTMKVNRFQCCLSHYILFSDIIKFLENFHFVFKEVEYMPVLGCTTHHQK